MALVTTLNGWLAQKKWVLHEHGLDNLVSELTDLFNGAIEGAGSAMPTGVLTIGACSLTTNIAPDQTRAIASHQAGQSGAPPANF